MMKIIPSNTTAYLNVASRHTQAQEFSQTLNALLNVFLSQHLAKKN